MATARGENKRRDQEGRNGRGRDVGIGIGDVVQHAEPQQRVDDAQQAAGDHGRPEGHAAVAGEGEPQQGDGESPDTNERGDEPGLGAADAAVPLPIAVVEPRLHGHEAEHDGHPHDEVEIRQVGVDGSVRKLGQTPPMPLRPESRGGYSRQVVVDLEHLKDAVQVQKEQAVGEPVVDAQKHDDGFRQHNAEGHRGNEAHLAQNVDVFFHVGLHDGDVGRVRRLLLLDGAADDDARQRLRDEAHDDGEDGGNDDAEAGSATRGQGRFRFGSTRRSGDLLDPEDPRQPQVGVRSDQLAYGRADTGASVRTHDEESHGLTGAVQAAEEVGDGSGDVGDGGTAGNAAEELEDDQHGQVVCQCGPNVENGVHGDGDDVDPFPASDVTVWFR